MCQMYFNREHTYPNKPGIVSSCLTWGTKKINTCNKDVYKSGRISK